MEKKKGTPIFVLLMADKEGSPVQDSKKLYYHQIEMDNGDKGAYRSKKDQQDYFVVGKQVDYEIGPKPKTDKPKETFTAIMPDWGDKYSDRPKAQSKPVRTSVPPADNTYLEIAIESNKRAIEAWLGNGIGREDIKEFSREVAQYLIDLINELNRTEG